MTPDGALVVARSHDHDLAKVQLRDGMRAVRSNDLWPAITHDIIVDSWTVQQARKAQDRVLSLVHELDVACVVVTDLVRVCSPGALPALRWLVRLHDETEAGLISCNEHWFSTALHGPEAQACILQLAEHILEDSRIHEGRKTRRAARWLRAHGALRAYRPRWGKGRLANATDLNHVHELRAQDHSIRSISNITGLSKSQVGRIVRDELKPDDLPVIKGGSNP